MSESAGWLLAIDTATTTVVVAAGTPDGHVLGTETFEGRHRHSQDLLPAIARLMEGAHLGLDTLAGVVVGIGPGAFTGLRVGLATAKTLAHELDRPVVGIATSDALLAALADEAVPAARLWLPSGARDRVMVARGRPPEVVPGSEVSASATDSRGAGEATAGPSHTDIAVDLEGRAPEAALVRGRNAVERLPATLLRLGAERLAAGEHDDPERLVPRYAAQPRGAPASEPDEEVAWSRDPR